MPQLEFADWAPQVVWLVIAFGLLYLLMARVALPRISEVLESRERRRTTDLEKAEILQGDAQRALEEFDRVQAETHATAQAIAAETRKKLAAEQAERLGELNGELAARYRRSEAEIAKATASAMSGLADLATELAQAAAVRLIGGKITTAAARDAVKAVEAQMQDPGRA